MGRRRNAAKWESWRERLEEFDRGNATVAEFCRQRGVGVATFYQWRRRLKSPDGVASRPNKVQAGRKTKGRQATQPLRFLPVEISAASQVEVWLTGGIRLLVPSHDAQAIRTVLTTLLADEREQRPC